MAFWEVGDRYSALLLGIDREDLGMINCGDFGGIYQR